MNDNGNRQNSQLLRFLPKIDRLLKTGAAQDFEREFGARKTVAAARFAVENLRRDLSENANYQAAEVTAENLLAHAETVLRERFLIERLARFQKVVNATGVIVHTNLGRAPLAERAKRAIVEIAVGYCTLEYDLATGKRGRRGREAEELLCEITGAESALVVNNCAAATFLILSALAANGEVVVSRGELVEIGGDFRIPDVMAQASAKMVEVGTTNRTKLRDFAVAINENTKMLVRVHPSNFRIVGFTEMPDLQDLAKLAREKNVLLFEDAGSGALVDLREYGLADEPVISESISAGADVVCFSADKLLGATQAGLIAGKREIIEKLRKHPLYRVLRADKIALAALAATLEIFVAKKHFDEIPVLRMLAQTRSRIERRAKEFVERFKVQSSMFKVQSENGENQTVELETLNFELVPGVSAIGGGSAPLAKLETVLIALRHKNLSADELERRLRFSSPPVVARVAENRVLIDLRTVSETEESEILNALHNIAQQT